MTHWPVLKHYDQNHLNRIALPLGGIGTGTISLGGRGDFRDCEIQNTPAKGNAGATPFFCIRTKAENEEQPRLKLLQGPMPDANIEGAFGATAAQHGLPRFQHASFDAAYPFGQVNLSEPDFPVTVTLQAFNPLVPADPDASGYPVAILRYCLRNSSNQALDVSICGTVNNCTGYDNADQQWRNTEQHGDGLAGVVCTSTNPELKGQDGEGELVIATPRDGGHITCRTDWLNHSWGFPLLDFWDDFTADGDLEPRTGPTKWPKASLCVRKNIPAQGEETFTFILAWRFPNRRTWTPLPADQRQDITPDNDPDIIGNYYCQRFPTAWSAAAEVSAKLPELEQKTLDFVNAFLQSPVPDTVKEAALFNLSTLRSQTVFRTPDGNLFGWEGCGDRSGSCYGSCTHVWNYEQSTPFLFGQLARSMRNIEFLHATDDEGLMSFRVQLPLERATKARVAAADGQLGCIMKAYREWLLSGDQDFLKTIWPKVRQAIEFIWVKGGWDADQDGIMEGCQHNTMDVEYFGPNAQMQAWYIGALTCAEIMAEAMQEPDFAKRCHDLALNGAKAMDEKLFNGDFYEQIIQPVTSDEDIHPGLKLHMGAKNLQKPDVQLGKACLVDQLVGLAMARIIGLPNHLDQNHVRKTLETIYKHNRVSGFLNHFNPMRSFVAADDTALLMASYPHGDRPQFPFPYYAEVMTGFEYTAAINMLYEGLTDEGLQVIEDIRKRYDGKHRSPFNEAECGHHYARAMAAWGAYLALSGFHYNGITGTMTFKDIQPGQWFWSTGDAYGTCTLAKDRRVVFTILGGTVKLNQLQVNDLTFQPGETLRGRTTIHC